MIDVAVEAVNVVSRAHVEAALATIIPYIGRLNRVTSFGKMRHFLRRVDS